MPDHQQAAIDAVKEALAEQYNRNLTRDESPYTPSDFTGMVEELVAAAEPHLRKKWAEELVERIGASNLGAPLRIFPDGTAHIASGPEMRALLCEFILEGAGE